MALDINRSYRAIINAAREQRFISYGEIAEASDEPWNKAYRVVPQQLGKLMEIAHERQWPYLSSIVVTKENAPHLDELRAAFA